ncbi:MAG: YdcF family protein [Cyanobacteria bacterium REEB417]|nr:YdcF family protein [Cyanobacteria bacterium REEB417]
MAVRRARPAKRPARPRRRRRRLSWRALVVATGGGVLLWLSRGWWWPAPPAPQMILVLGGDVAREQAAAELARQRGLPVVVSGGSNPEYAHWLFSQREGLPREQVLLDYRAQDTVSNFTSLVDELRRARIRHAFLVTSSDHMQRALLVGRLVAGSRGIKLTPVPVSCLDRCIQEPASKIWRDGLRSALWVFTGLDLRWWAAERLPPWLGGQAAVRSPGSALDPAEH